MGCTSSKLDDLPAVALCRERCSFLDEAIHYRYALAEAHVAYLHSLKTVGVSLNRFFHHVDVDVDVDLLPSSPSSPSHSPVVNRKPELPVHHSHSSSGSHLHFHSDSDSDSDSGSDSLHHHHIEQQTSIPMPIPQYGQFTYGDHETLGGSGPPGLYPPVLYGATSYSPGPFTHMNYMRNQTTPSVTYEQRPITPEIVRMGEASASSSSNSNNLNPNYMYPPDYPNYGAGFFFSPTQQPRPYGVSSGAGPSSAPSTSKPPPPPPSPPRSSPWDFLNPFETFENYPPYTPSRDSREVREEEGIPDLEDEDFEHEVVKEVHGDQKFVADTGGKAVAADKESDKHSESESLYRGRHSESVEEDEQVEYEVHVVDKKVVDEEGNSRGGGNVAAFKPKDDSEVIREIQVQLDRASEYGKDLAKLLEVGKLPHNRKHVTYQVSSKMLHAITNSLSVVSSDPSTSKSAEMQIANPAVLDVEGDVISRQRNLSSTLNKLHLWEKKLYQEVKSEEKIRVLHERKSQKLKRLDERGAEAHKVDLTRQLVRSLSTKIRIAIQVVDKISEKINKMRDEELWPQLHEFIQGLCKMWKGMLECHHNHCQAIGEAKRLDAIASHKHFSDAHLEATLQLEQELLNWTLRFSCWVNAQKGFVRSLNTWLMKCLLYVPEETADGTVPFSPGRIGAPPIFIICNQWSQSIEGVSEMEVVDRMRDFAANVLQLWERDKHEMRQRMMVNKDMEKKVKNLEREDQKMQKEINALGKRIVLVSREEGGLSLNRHVVYQSDTSKNSSLQVGLRQIFEAMERFTAKSLKVYEELLQRIEEDDLA